MAERNCYFCKTRAKYEKPIHTQEGLVFAASIDCPGCGPYIIDEQLELDLAKEDVASLFRLCCLIRENRHPDGEGCLGLFKEAKGTEVALTSLNISRWWLADDLLKEFPKPTELIDRTLSNLSRLVEDRICATVH